MYGTFSHCVQPVAVQFTISIPTKTVIRRNNRYHPDFHPRMAVLGLELRLPCYTGMYLHTNMPYGIIRFPYIQGESPARDPKLFSVYTVEQRGFLVRKYWQTGSFKACQTVF